MQFFPSEQSAPIEYSKTEIKHITKDDQGRFKGHYLIGLTKLDQEWGPVVLHVKPSFSPSFLFFPERFFKAQVTHLHSSRVRRILNPGENSAQKRRVVAFSHLNNYISV